MSKHVKLSILLSAGWLVLVLTAYLTGRFGGNENDAFLAYSFAGIALVNLMVWGARWLSLPPAD